jgi:hypothetical protein
MALPSVAVSFSGSGFLAAFHMGALQALLAARVPIAVVGGASGGALVAAGHAMGVAPSDMLSRLIDTAEQCRRDGFSSIPKHLNTAIKATLPPDYEVKQLSTLRVAVTALWPYERVLVEKFEDREDLIAALETSCHIPFYLGSFARDFRGKPFFVDGGLGSVAPPLKGDRVITVLSFPIAWTRPALPSHVKADLTRVIAPQWTRPIQNPIILLWRAVVPPSREILQQLYDMGQTEGERFVKERL